MKIRLFPLFWLALLSGPISPLSRAQSTGFDEFLTFDDNQVPAGWAITFPYGGPGRNAEVVNQRFQIEQIDTYAALDKDKTLPSGTNEVHISFRCEVQDVSFGMGYEIHLLMSDGGDFLVKLAKVGFGIEQMNVSAGANSDRTFDQNYTPDYGIYILDAFFQDGQITFTAIKEGSETALVSTTIEVGGLAINNLKTVRLFGVMTTGGPAWIDDALIEALQSLPVITSPLVATGTLGLPFSYQFEATDATSLAVSDLPDGLKFDPDLRAIVGNPTVEGTFQVGLSASNGTGTTNATLTLTVQPFPVAGPVIMNVTSATGRTGSPFSFQVITSGGSSLARVSATGLPAGLTIDSVTGEISGTVTTDGSFSVTLSATEAGITNTATLQLTFTSDLAVPVIVSPNSALLFPGLAFSYTIVAPSSDLTDPITYSVVGALAPGLSLDPATGIISGTPLLTRGLQPTPSLAGGVVTNVQIFACNSSGCAAQGLFFLLPTGAANISTRLSVGTDDNVLIGGFITQGNAPMKLVVRGMGPSLPLGGPLADPYLELHSGAVTIASNDNWKDNLTGGSQEVAIENTNLAPTNDLESALLGVLDPGGYTAIVRGVNNGTGVGLVEVYSLGAASMDLSSEAHLANISTRGDVQTGDNVMIGGFINQGSVPIQVLVRGIGPSLTPFGVSGALANPVLELHKPDGTVVMNDDWMTDQKADIMATGLAPTNALESAILLTLPVGEGAYTAIMSGANGTTGVGLVEAYFGNPCLGTSCP
jgi:hypothetical protein